MTSLKSRIAAGVMAAFVTAAGMTFPVPAHAAGPMCKIIIICVV
jgi:hypothetical protein